MFMAKMAPSQLFLELSSHFLCLTLSSGMLNRHLLSLFLSFKLLLGLLGLSLSFKFLLFHELPL